MCQCVYVSVYVCVFVCVCELVYVCGEITRKRGRKIGKQTSRTKKCDRVIMRQCVAIREMRWTNDNQDQMFHARLDDSTARTGIN